MFTFPYKHDPFEHQREALRRSFDKYAYAFFMQQGTGKSKVYIDLVAYQYMSKIINGVLLVAPNGVHTNWDREQIPEHMTEDVGYKTLLWRSDRSNNVSFLDSFKALLRFPGLSIFIINIDAFTTAKGKAAVKTFLTTRKCSFGIDESADIRTAGAARTKSIRALGKYSITRAIMSGLPDPEGPLDLYPQMQFLDPDILRCGNALAFKHEYTEFRVVPAKTFSPNQRRDALIPLKDADGRPRYKNLDKLNRLISPVSYRVLRAECLDLPEQLYTTRYFDLSPEAERMYREMYNEYETKLGEESATASIRIVRDLRLQQIASGYIPVDPDPNDPDSDNLQPERVIPGGNPRLDLLMETLKESDYAKTIIWCRYRYDVKLIMDALAERGVHAVRYDGTATLDEKDQAKIDFQKGDARVFVGNAKVGGRGLTLTAAETTIYYTNYWGLDPRMQSEDRVHRIGLTHNVLYIDLIGQIGGKDFLTVDENIVKALRAKNRVSEVIMGDAPRAWI